MSRRRLAFASLVPLFLVLALTVACSPSVTRYPSQPEQQAPKAAYPTAAPQATSAPAAAQSRGDAPPADSGAAPQPASGARAAESSGEAPAGESVPLAQAERLVIKSAEIDVLVADTSAAVDQVLGVASDVDGYVLNMSTWQEGGYTLAKVTLRMPADRYEEALRRLRRIGEVQKESSAGEDVTDQYVDLESELRNLEATAERLRGFLDMATTIEEALTVNEKMKQIEVDIERVKGRLNYLGDRAAYSTISIYLHPVRPTPTPTSTPTITPTMTPTPTPMVIYWNPVRTATRAGGVLVDIVKVLVDLGIWLAILGLPLLGPVVIVAFLYNRYRRSHEAGPPTSLGPGPDASNRV